MAKQADDISVENAVLQEKDIEKNGELVILTFVLYMSDGQVLVDRVVIDEDSLYDLVSGHRGKRT